MMLTLCEWMLAVYNKILLYTDTKRALCQTTQANVNTLSSEKLSDDSKMHFSNDRDNDIESACEKFE